jgi:hypothetical protein
MDNRTAVVGVFRNRLEADQAIDDLHLAGFREDQIGFAWRKGDAPEGTTVSGDDTRKPGEGLAAGAVVGGLIGAAAALLIPGVGPVVSGGILATTFGAGATAAGAAAAGAAVGATAGGLIGALTGMGVPDDEASYYDREFQQGRILVTVKADGRYDEARSILLRHGAYDIRNRSDSRTMAR